MEWSEGGRGSGTTHLGTSSPVSVHACSPLFVSRGGCFGWWWFVRVVVRGSWVMVKGAHRCPVIARPIVAITCPLPRVVVLLISKRGWEEHGMVGYLPCVLKSTTNNIHCLSFGRHVTVSDVAPGFHEVGSRCYPWVVAFIGKWSFPFISGCLRSWAVVFIGDCRW